MSQIATGQSSESWGAVDYVKFGNDEATVIRTRWAASDLDCCSIPALLIIYLLCEPLFAFVVC